MATGTELARLIRGTKGKISIRAMFGNDSPYIYAEKADLIQYFNRCGTEETGLTLNIVNGDAFVDTII